MRRFLPCLTTLLLLLPSAAWLAGCTSAQALSSARASLGRARAAGAEAAAPYDYYMAESFLADADHEAGEGDYRQARVFASRSEECSLRARRVAEGGAR